MERTQEQRTLCHEGRSYQFGVFRHRRFRKMMSLVVCAGLILVCQVVQASQVTFAQFQQATTGNPFVFTNSGAGSTFVAVNVPVNFQYLIPNSYGAINQNIPAHLTLSATVAAPAIVAGPLAAQPLKDIVISIIADNDIGGLDELLRVDLDGNNLSTGNLAGILGGHVALQSGDTSSALPDNFAYFSDFIGAGTFTSGNYALSFSSVLNNFSINGNGYLSSFLAAGTGTFAAIVPEPATGVMLVAGAGLALRMLRRGKRRV